MSSVEHLADGVTLHLGDCRDVLPTLSRSDAIISDPPYGVAFSHGGNDRSGIGRGAYATKFAGQSIVGDDKPFEPEWLLDAANIVVLWGANHFAQRLPSSSSWFVWDKRAASQHTNDFADCELAWTNKKGVARVFRHQWDGMMRASERGVARVHPTQKPIELMRWCIQQVTSDAQTVLDPFMGSGSTGCAAVMLGRPFTGIEIDANYFAVACRRVEDALRRPDMFAPRNPEPKQEGFAW